ncbi:hypothetical protein, partial [Yersinia enterocolitica]
IYEALIIHLFRHNFQPEQYNDGTLWPLLKMPANVTLIKSRDLMANQNALNSIQNELSKFIELHVIQPDELSDFNLYVEELNAKGLEPETAYQFIKGHILHDHYVFPMLKTYRDKLCSIERAKIGRECRGHNKAGEREARTGEVENFFNKTNLLETLLNNTLNYTHNSIYNKIESKLRNINS